MPPKGKPGLSKGRDDYAAWRCKCGHLVYHPSYPCIASVAYPDGPRCSCTDHRIPEPPRGDAA